MHTHLPIIFCYSPGNIVVFFYVKLPAFGTTLLYLQEKEST